MDYRNVEFWHVLIGTFLRYFVFAGIAYLVFYVWKKSTWIRFKIQQVFPREKAVRTELLYSLMTMFIFAAVIYGLLFTGFRDFTKIYTDIHEYPVTWFLISLFIIIFLHDTYFYWTHRLMHWKKLFPFVHHIHHRSHNPTPLAAFSFHPLEALIEIGILPIVAFTFPVHRGAIGVFGAYMIIMNVMGHLGYELYPKWFLKNRISKWMNTSTHHNMHHHYGKGNYGLYFNFWDRILGTNHPEYETRFNQVVESRNRQIKESTAVH